MLVRLLQSDRSGQGGSRPRTVNARCHLTLVGPCDVMCHLSASLTVVSCVLIFC